MKRLIVLYEFPDGDQDHLTNFFPLFKRLIVELVRYHFDQQILLPGLIPAFKSQQ